jgi:hypothetical protein
MTVRRREDKKRRRWARGIEGSVKLAREAEPKAKSLGGGSKELKADG